MKRSILRALGVLAVLLPAASSSNPQCPRCDVVSEGILNDSLVGQYVYEQGESGRFYREQVVKVRTYPPAIYRQIGDGNYYWEEASHFYSESSMNEITAAARGSAPTYQQTTDDQNRANTVAIACRSYEKAVNDGDTIMAFLMERACCESTDGKKYGRSKICPA